MENRKVTSLDDRLKKHEEDYESKKEDEYRKEDILNELRETPLWGDESMRIKYWNLDSTTLDLELHNVSIETVIDTFCSCLHKAYGIDWKMHPTGYDIRLTSKYRDPQIIFEVNEEDKKTCELRKKITKTRNDKELELFRHEYAYEMDCGNAE